MFVKIVNLLLMLCKWLMSNKVPSQISTFLVGGFRSETDNILQNK